MNLEQRMRAKVKEWFNEKGYKLTSSDENHYYFCDNQIRVTIFNYCLFRVQYIDPITCKSIDLKYFNEDNKTRLFEELPELSNFL